MISKIKVSPILIFLVMLNLLKIQAAPRERIERIEPPNWWIGMKDPNLQLLVKGTDISESRVETTYPGIEIVKVTPGENKAYLFVDLQIQPQAKPGTVEFTFTDPKKKKFTRKYQLRERENPETGIQELNYTDVIYLITPDRFVNGDPENDQVNGMLEGPDRQNIGGRHGGDLAGIISKLDYMEDLGVTTLWLNPVVENNMQDYSYHGYAITNFYQVDPRYGSNQLYRQLSDELHQRNMKLVMDMVFNHCGLEHWWIKEPPFSNWIHHHPEYTNTNHAIGAISDPYAVKSDLVAMEEGWFVPTMPDLNHDNPFLANYLIQNSIWWIEFARLDGIRMDTYPYNKPATMVEWVERVENEYPGFFLLGETWVHNEPQEAFWAAKNPEKQNELNTGLKSITDFPMTYGIHKAFGKDGNVEALYDVLNKDFLYYRPFDNTIFADNHDMDRIFYTLNEDLGKFKMAMTFLFTTRGFPQLYYGTEILMKGSGDHGIIREEFPGGWANNQRNAFTVEGRSATENEAFKHIQTLLQWRKNSDAILNGSLKHYKPMDNIYVMSRASDKEKIVVLFNNQEQSVEISREDYSEVFQDADEALDVLSGKFFSDLNQIEIPANSSLVLQLKGNNLKSMK